jgi:hypothetical protein
MWSNGPAQEFLGLVDGKSKIRLNYRSILLYAAKISITIYVFISLHVFNATRCLPWLSLFAFSWLISDHAMPCPYCRLGLPGPCGCTPPSKI